MSISGTPRRKAIATPSPVPAIAFDVILKMRPKPPVATRARFGMEGMDLAGPQFEGDAAAGSAVVGEEDIEDMECSSKKLTWCLMPCW